MLSAIQVCQLFLLNVTKISFIHHICPGVDFRCVIIESVSPYTQNPHRATKAPWYKSKAIYDDHGALVALCGFWVYGDTHRKSTPGQILCMNDIFVTSKGKS